MDYNFNFLTLGTFEHLIQSLSRKILGNGLITFGDGPDGGREATFEGKAPFPSNEECWTGRWVIQAKFKAREDKKKDFNWVRNEFGNEMKKFETRKVKMEIPDNYLFFTNVVLTPTAKTGGRDKIEELVDKYKSKIKNIKIFGYDDLCGFLENNRDVATAYASFILPGDILQLLYKILQKMDVSKKSHQDLLGRFLEAEFKDDLQSRLDHAGKLTSDKIHLEKVFVDLYATRDGIVPKDEKQKKFLELCLEEGNCILRPDARSLRYVLIGGPGFGKSTLTQFLCQVYRAYFLQNIDKTQNPLPEIHSFIKDLKEIMPITPTCSRFPFKIKLKDFAGWIAEQKAKEKKHTMLLYLKYKIEKKGDGGTIEIGDIKQLLKSLSFVFIFDGLDEVPVTSNREDVLAEINNFIDIDLRRYNCDAMVIATTRPQGYTTEFDTSRYKHLTITDLKEEDCLVYLERLLKAIDPVEEERVGHLEILNNALKDDIISPLMRSPLQASIMAILVKSGGEPPRYKYDLFTEYYNIICRREKQKNICKILNENPEYIDDIHYKLGFNLQLSSEQSENPYSHISSDDFRNFVFRYLEGWKLSKEEAEVKTGQILQATTERLVFLEEVEDGKIGFNIRSLQEYFAANYYLQHQPDDIIHKRLRYMCESAFWRNTFLFALGYIFKENDYIIDYIESICRELNGSGDEPGKTSGAAACKLGSWLALDIINEGILRGYPKFENKFVRLLEDLFTISPSYKHSKFGSLSDDIKQKWILPFIDKYTSHGTYEQQLAGWTIGIYLLRYHFEPVTGIFNKNWLTGEAEIKLIRHFIKLRIHENDWFIEKFLSALKGNPCFIFNKELSNDKFAYEVALSSSNDFDTKRILIQNLFLESISRIETKYYQAKAINLIFKDEIIKVPDEELYIPYENILYDRVDEIDIELFAQSYRIETFLVKTTKKNTNKLIKVFSKYDMPYLEYLTRFISTPNKDNLINFIEKLGNEPSDVFDIIKKKLQKVNWLLTKVFHDEESPDKIIQNIKENRYGDTDDWLDFEKRMVKNKIDYELIDILKHPLDRRWMSGGANRSVLESFYKDFYLKFKIDKKLKSKDVLYWEFIFLVAWYFIDLFEDFKNYLKRNKSIIDEIFYCLKKVITREFNFLIFNLFFCLTEQEIMNTVKRERELLEKFNFDKDHTWYIHSELIDDVFPRLARILNLNLTFKEESLLIKVLVWVLLEPNLKTLPALDINYNDLHQAAYKDPENEACRILLCLFDPAMNQEKSNRMVEISNQLFKTIPKLPDHIIQLIEKFKIKGDWVESFLLEIYQLVDKYDHDVKTKFENYLKDMLESLPSHLNEEKVRKKLNLVN